MEILFLNYSLGRVAWRNQRAVGALHIGAVFHRTCGKKLLCPRARLKVKDFAQVRKI